VISYTVQYSPTEYVDGRVTYRARLMLENTVPVLISDDGWKTEPYALVGLAYEYINTVLGKTNDFIPLSRLPSELRDTVEDVIASDYPKGTQDKIRARIRRREKQSLKERTVQ
jgi:hypothetical protein